jgi:hypothetical protein
MLSVSPDAPTEVSRMARDPTKLPVPYPIFLDTEFTQFDNPALISIGLVALEGEEPVTFYAESTDFPHKRASGFVREQVLSKLEGGAAAMPTRRIAEALGSWLAARRPGWVLVSDFPDYDGELLARLLRMALGQDSTAPPVVLFRPNLLPQAQAMAAVQMGGEVLARHGQHHALVDATSLMSAWLAAEATGWDGGGYLLQALLTRH